LTFSWAKARVAKKEHANNAAKAKLQSLFVILLLLFLNKYWFCLIYSRHTSILNKKIK
jgi:hypothetical protein